MHPALTRVAMLPVAPVLFAQGKRLRRTTPRLPDAALPWHGSVEVTSSAKPTRLLVIGDSTAAGVGASTQDDGLPGNLARELSARWSTSVSWKAVGRNGATARDLLDDYVDEATSESFDVVFVSIGANDALGIRSRAAFGRDIQSLLARLRDASPAALIIVSSLPAFHRFELLPNPLRFNLYAHSQALESRAREIVAGLDRVVMSPPPPPYTEGFFADDLFHPSAQGYRDWARFALDDAFSNGLLA